ncbi:phytanoyl-CoA dioxygenase family protein [Paenibacillus sp. MWE-103]|uniref:Phytanoyl-CoA dioxygenase family protein n=1 Tax=Paenibacillus artemisiicola TaxID=1172618 RepID=A0ABS3WAH1_9BACL|nr:phytanoyl-CoA dioxygenase family protein [Paenibacillus artemisiicola]MBO7745321.1 phytanoyl-CoA dioxygenase family protein [Paenibacillus artemisiicola]
MRLTQAQIDYFETFGLLKFPQLMVDRLDWIVGEFAKTFPGTNKHDGTKRTCVVPFIDQRMSVLLDDPRILAIGRSLLGDDFNYMGSDGNYYTGDTGWHRDGYHEKYRHLKIAFYLDRLDGGSGALRVIPGSHRLRDNYAGDLTARMRNPRASWEIEGADVPAVVLDVVPGDLLVFDHNTFHSSWNGSANRRMFTINLCQRYAEEDLQELRDYIGTAARFWIDRAYSETMMRTATPERLVHLEQVMANDGHLAALSAKARLEMAEPARG